MIGEHSKHINKYLSFLQTNNFLSFFLHFLSNNYPQESRKTAEALGLERRMNKKKVGKACKHSRESGAGFENAFGESAKRRVEQQ
jgi:hypothetical protein